MKCKRCEGDFNELSGTGLCADCKERAYTELEQRMERMYEAHGDDVSEEACNGIWESVMS